MSDLAAHSVVVVRGIPLAVTGAAKAGVYPRSTEDAHLPLRPGEGGEAGGGYRVVAAVDFQVNEYMKGQGPEIITFHIINLGFYVGDIPPQEIITEFAAKVANALEPGKEYVLFLNSARPDGTWTADDILWNTGDQGRWVVTGESAYRPQYPKTLSLNTLRAAASKGK